MKTLDSALADTSAVIDHLRGNAQTTSLLVSRSALYLPAIVVGELQLGVFRSRRPASEQLALNAFVLTTAVVNVTRRTALFYARLRASLLAVGTPIPENDTWIAALALEHDLPLIARDAHFHAVPGLTLLRS